MASSSVTLYTPSAAIESCAAVTALTAEQDKSGQSEGCGGAELKTVRTSETVPLDTGNLNEPVDGITGQAKVVL